MRRLLVLAAGALLATGPAAGAATIAVDTTSDAMAADGHCSLREAITAANTDNFPEPGPNECPRGDGADTITLGPGSFEFALSGADDDFNNTGDLDIAGPTTITGAGALLTTIDAKQLDRVFDILSGASLSLSGVTVTGGRAPDGLNGATAGASGFAGEDGGAIHNQGAVTLTDCVVTGNRTGNGGAGASATGSGGGLGTSGGAGGFAQGGAGGAGGAGGGLWNNGSMTLTRVVVSSNATGDGGNGGAGSGAPGGAQTGATGDG
jgi:CSLREA domain-containing protein